MPRAAVLLLAPLLLVACAAEVRRGLHSANIVLILVDDLGWRDVGCQGQELAATPRIDGLARQGMRFTQAYAANPVCSPTRAALLTGQHPERFGIHDWIPGTPFPKARMLPPPNTLALPLAAVTLAEALRAQGYATWHVGKWHLGGDGFLPGDQGFDVNWFGSDIGHPASYFFPYDAGDPANDHRVVHLPPGGHDGQWLPDHQAAAAAGLIRGAAHRGRPFFLYLPFYAVHVPIQPRPDDLLRAQAARQARILAAPAEQQEAVAKALPDAKYAAMLEGLDRAVGTVLDALTDCGLDDETVVVFTSDNGGLSGVSDNRPLRGGKRSLWEGGLRVPLLVRWPGVVAAGSENALPVVSQDVHRGLRSVGGAPVDDVVAEDAIDLLPVWRGERWSRRPPLFWHFPQHETAAVGPRGAVRHGDHKLIEDLATGRAMLFDLAQDPGESHDLAASQPARTTQLLGELRAWRQRVGAAMPVPNPAFVEAK